LKKILFSILFLLLSLSLEANYCIQVLTTDGSEKNSVIRKASSKQYDKFNLVRVESRGRYLVFRIGDYLHYRDATEDMYELRKTYKDAYIRQCSFVKKKALYVNHNKREEIPSYNQRKSKAARNPVKTERYTQSPVKKVYKEKKELKYKNVTSSDTLWGECKKCFVPVYEDESENDYPERQVQKSTRHIVKAQHSPAVVMEEKSQKYESEDDYPGIAVEQHPIDIVKKQLSPKVMIKEKPQKVDTFWSDETRVQESEATKIERPKVKPKNKFNIDEQFLP